LTPALPAYVCALLNGLAAVALATVLAPGTTLVDPGSRSSYVGEHLLAWRLGWSLWILAAISLLWFYAWWRARIRAGGAALPIAAVGFVADLVAESGLIALVPDRPELAPTAFLLTGGVANACYSVAGILLSLETRALRGALVPWTAAMWASGLALSAFAALAIPLGVAAATAVLFALFLPWVVVVGRRLA
jgi:hypothetical protein